MSFKIKVKFKWLWLSSIPTHFLFVAPKARREKQIEICAPQARRKKYYSYWQAIVDGKFDIIILAPEAVPHYFLQGRRVAEK